MVSFFTTAQVMKGLIPKMGMTFDTEEVQQLYGYTEAVVTVVVNNLEHMGKLK